MRVVVFLLAALLLSGCGAAGQAAADPVNADDVMFLQMMIPHHKQGVEIVRLGRDQARSAELKTLAAAIESTQTEEITRMTRWLHGWQQPLTAPSDAHAGHEVPETDLQKITSLRRSKNFDRDLLNLLIAHQDDAAQLAVKEGFAGANPEVKDWAKQVELSRKDQITLMLDLLKRTP
ncbi:MAG: DUF305 domain-containing protein [Thermoactinospora sp.]|nr:DUF305 domain-containing protein [Thermoactinospora sp.]